MVKNDISTKLEEGEATSWVGSLVNRQKKNGRLRLCLVPKDLIGDFHSRRDLNQIKQSHSFLHCSPQGVKLSHHIQLPFR